MNADSRQYHRGRFARAEGKPRVIPDGRMSSQTRMEWYEGWDQEDRNRRPPPTPEEEAETNEALQMARDFLTANGYPPTER